MEGRVRSNLKENSNCENLTHGGKYHLTLANGVTSLG